MAMAPIEDPKIAIVVVVENGYFGARIAGPIASLMIEEYLTKNVKRKIFYNLNKIDNLKKDSCKNYKKLLKY